MTETRPLPEGWRWGKLGEVCEVVTGSTPRTNDPTNWNGEILWATPNDMGKLVGFTIDGTERKISEKGFKSCGTKLLPSGSVLLTTRAPIGHLAINLKPMCTNQGFKSFIPSSQIHSWFLFFFLKYSVPVLQSMGRGQTFTEISKNQVDNFEISHPPPLEQERIAAKVQELMAQVDHARTACEAQLEAAKALPTAYLRQAFESEETKTWPRKKFEEIAILQRGYDLPSYKQIPGEYPIMTSSGISGTHNEYKAKGPGIITGRSGSIGKVYFVDKDYWPHNTALFVKDFRGNEPRYIFSLLQWVNLNALSGGTGVPTLDRKAVHKVIVPHPNREKQICIAATLNEQMACAEKLRTSIEAQLEVLKALPQAILRKAFSGEL